MLLFLLACTGDGPGSSEADTDSDGTVDSEDCAPEDSAIHPGADELCDGIDNDCDGETDGADAVDIVTWYADNDGDGYGDDEGAVQIACEQPSGYTSEAGDCDDSDADVTPATNWYPDIDGDGYGDEASPIQACEQPAAVYILVGGDCFDGSVDVHPGADEYCDGVDSDCDGELDEGDALDAVLYYVDSDGDGYGGDDGAIASCTPLSGYGTEGGDCDDENAEAYPGSTHREVPFDGSDTDCDGNDFCTDLDCDGLPDVVIPIQYSGSSYAADSWVYFGKGDYLTDTARRALPTNYGRNAIAEDIDGDGYVDVVFAQYYDGSTYEVPSRIYWGTDGGPRDSIYTDLAVYGAYDVIAEDLDSDGDVDLAFASHYDGDYETVSAIYWGPDFAEESRTEIATTGAVRLGTGDLDGDGNTDLAICQYKSDSSYSIDSQVLLGPEFVESVGLATIGCRDVLIDDLNGDGWADVVFASHYGGSSYSTSSYVYWGYEGGPSTAYRASLPTHGSADVEVGDVDGDGWDDLVFSAWIAGTSSSSTAYIYTYYGSSLGFSSEVVDTLALKYVWDLELADLDGDGWLDLLTPVYHTGSSYSTTSYLWWGGEEGWSSEDRTDFETFGSAGCGVGDMDSDGMVDLVFGSYYGGTWSSPSDSYVYWSSDDYSDPDVLETYGNWGKPLIVGSKTPEL